MTPNELTDQIMAAIATDAGNSREVVLGLVHAGLQSFEDHEGRCRALLKVRDGEHLSDAIRQLVKDLKLARANAQDHCDRADTEAKMSRPPDKLRPAQRNETMTEQKEQHYILIPEPAGDWQDGDMIVDIGGIGSAHRLRPVDSSSRWIPLSERKPTAEDADENGYVVLRDHAWPWAASWEGANFGNASHFLPLPKLTPQPSADEVNDQTLPDLIKRLKAEPEWKYDGVRFDGDWLSREHNATRAKYLAVVEALEIYRTKGALRPLEAKALVTALLAAAVEFGARQEKK